MNNPVAEFLHDLLYNDRNVDVDSLEEDDSFKLYVDDWVVTVTVSKPEVFP